MRTQLLNISRDWLTALLPFVLGKINRVSYGLLHPADLERAKTTHPRMPLSRALLAVPFIGKDVPVSHFTEQVPSSVFKIFC